MKVHIDFETYSPIDLEDSGVHVYADHPEAEILCMAYAIDDGEVQLWLSGPLPLDLIAAVEAGAEIYAHNANFELLLWNFVGVKKYGWPGLNIANVHCTMAMALAMSLPASLKKLALVLELPFQKDMGGHRIMMQLSRPKKDGSRWLPSEVPEKFERLYEYCKGDVEVERAALKHLNPLIPSERRLWILDNRINNRGLQIDTDTVKNMIAIVEAEKLRLDGEMRRLTDQKVASGTATKRLKDWIVSQGVTCEGVAKDSVLDLLSMDIPDCVRTALLIRQQASKTSTAKLPAMLKRVGADGKARGIHQYHAAGTGRFGGRGVNFQNIKRPFLTHAQIEQVIVLVNELHIQEACEMIHVIYGDVMDVVSDCIRAMVTASPGKKLLACDLASIESRMLAWLAGEEKKLQIFRTHGKAYEASASEIYRVALAAVTKEQRQIGKVAELALGFQGGVGAFQSMAANYNVKVSDQRAEEIKNAWRQSNPNICKYWYALENAARKAVVNPGVHFVVRTVVYQLRGKHLYCRLPSGREICYPFAKLESKEMPWGDIKETVTYLAEDAETKQIIRAKGYGGLWTENNTQGAARDVFVEALLELEDFGFDTVMHNHDEIVCDLSGLANHVDLKRMEHLMTKVPSWAPGLPIAAEGWMGFRYRK